MAITLFGQLIGRTSNEDLTKAQLASEILGVVHNGTLDLMILDTVIGTASVTGFTDTQNRVISNSTQMILTSDVTPTTANLRIRYTAPGANEGFIATVDGTNLRLANAMTSGQTLAVSPLTWGMGAGATDPTDFPPPTYPSAVARVILDSQSDSPIRTPDSYIGMHFHGWPLPGEIPPDGYAVSLTAEPTYDFHLFRNHNNTATSFLSRIFPTQGSTGEFGNLQAVYGRMKQDGRKVLHNNIAMPQWLSKIPNHRWAYPSLLGGAGTPNDWPTYYDRIQRLISYCNKGANANNPLIDYFETWNEPDLDFRATAEAGFGVTFFAGADTDNSAAGRDRRRTELARLQKESYLAVKSIDPNVKVTSPGIVWWNASDPDKYLQWLDTPTGTGGVAGDFVDVLSSHHYDARTDQRVTGFNTTMGQLRYIRGRHAGHKPIIQTETGLLHGSYMTTAQHGLKIRRILLAGVGWGLETNILYSAEGGLSTQRNGGIVYDLIGNPSREPVVSQALQQAYNELNGRRFIDVVELENGQMWARDDQLQTLTI